MKETLKIRRIVQRRNPSSVEKRRIGAARRYYQQKKPSLEQLIQDGKVESVVPWGEYLALQEVFQALRGLRKKRRLSLATLAKKTGIGKAALSRLENGVQGNPTLGTICRYADALGATIRIALDTRGGVA